MTRIGALLSNKEFIVDVMFNDLFGAATSTTTQREGESIEDARTRGEIEALQKFTRNNPIKVDENYNLIVDDEDEEDYE